MRYMTIYNFEELSVEAKKKAIENVRDEYTDDQNPWAEENANSIRSITEAMNCDYEIDDYNHVSLYFDNEYAEEVLSLEGNRAYAYIWNNFIEPNLKPKYICGCKIDGKLHYGCVGKGSISYYSKVTKEFNCPFTGYCGDMLLWDAWESFKKDFTKYTNVVNFISEVEYTIGRFLDDEDNYYYSDDYIKDVIEAEEIEFTENGDIV